MYNSNHITLHLLPIYAHLDTLKAWNFQRGGGSGYYSATLPKKRGGLLTATFEEVLKIYKNRLHNNEAFAALDFHQKCVTESINDNFSNLSFPKNLKVNVLSIINNKRLSGPLSLAFHNQKNFTSY